MILSISAKAGLTGGGVAASLAGEEGWAVVGVDDGCPVEGAAAGVEVGAAGVETVGTDAGAAVIIRPG